jgi:hypothetical protein
MKRLSTDGGVGEISAKGGSGTAYLRYGDVRASNTEPTIILLLIELSDNEC